jgi:ubiquinone biosynthesis protein UbiJ
MIDQFASAAAIALLNRMLAEESWARDKLAPFAGRSARFEATPFSLHLRIVDGGAIGAAGDEPPAVTIGMNLANLPLALSNPQAAMRDLTLKGDAEFAQALAFVLQNLRPDPEEPLSRLIGDAAAQRVVGLLRAGASQWREVAERMLDNAANYFVAENPMVVDSREVADFSGAVNRLRDDLARLTKRIERFEQR